jgi:hypothetical protein
VIAQLAQWFSAGQCLRVLFSSMQNPSQAGALSLEECSLES